MPKYTTYDLLQLKDYDSVIGRVYNHDDPSLSYDYRGKWAQVYRNNQNMDIFDVYEAYVETKGGRKEAWAVMSWDREKYRMTVVTPELTCRSYFSPMCAHVRALAYTKVWESLGVAPPKRAK